MNWLIHLWQSTAVQRRKSTRLVRAILQIFVLLLLAQEIRKRAKSYGVHSKVGSMMGYGTWMMYWIMGKKQVAEATGSDATPDEQAGAVTSVSVPTIVIQ